MAEPIGAVVIGRNEGERLSRCLRSVRSSFDAVVYVDSNSRDGSPERAKAEGADVIVLDHGPFTAARGRQAGLERLRQLVPGLEFVQFIDGDCILDPEWRDVALEALLADEKRAAVCGRRREEGTNFYSRLIDIDWDIPPGEVPYFGGDLLARARAIDEAGGWPVRLIAGEEPDLSFRLRDRGWRILRLSCEATRHDVAMTRFGQYWKRSVRSGHAYAEVGLANRRGAGRGWARRCLNILAYGLVLPIMLVASAILWWPASVAIALAYIRLGWTMYRACRRKGNPRSLSLAYAGLNTACKAAGAWGMIRYGLSRLRGARTRLIEYKPAPKLEADAPIR